MTKTAVPTDSATRKACLDKIDEPEDGGQGADFRMHLKPDGRETYVVALGEIKLDLAPALLQASQQVAP